MTWFERNKTTLHALFDALGATSAWSEDPQVLWRWSSDHWLGLEHGEQSGKPIYTKEQQDAAKVHLTDLGLTKRIEPQRDRYDEVLVMGAAAIGLYRRLGLVREAGITAERLTVLAGLRPHERAARDGALVELLSAEGRFAAQPGWRAPAVAARRQELISGLDDHTAAAVVFPSESDLAELLIGKHFPAARLTSTLHASAHAVENELGQRDWLARTYAVPGGRFGEVRVLNCAPVQRPGRPSRPTALSTLDEWVSLHTETGGPLPRSVLVVVNQPHLKRVFGEVTRRLSELGHSGVEVDVAGCETVDAGVLLLLGEVPATLNYHLMTGS